MEIQNGKLVRVTAEEEEEVLSKPERNYCVTRRELLAVVKSVEHFYKYLYGREFLLRTDHAALKWLLNFKSPEGQVARWIERLQEFAFTIEHRSGSSHRNADALSRRPCPENCKHCCHAEEKMSPTLRVTVINDKWQPRELQKDQRDDAELKHIWKWKTTGRRPSWQEIASCSSAVKSYWAQWDSIAEEEGVLKRVVENEDGSQKKMQILLPRKRIPEVLKELHDGTSGGHLGITKTLEKVRERFYWVNSKQDVKMWCTKCQVCATSNGPHRKKRAKMRQYNVGSPFERIAIDLAGPFPMSDDGNKYILVTMDYFSKWVEAYPLPNQEATTISDVIVKEWVSRFGVPLELHSDQGRNFESEVFQGVCELLGIRKTRTTALHPQSDGMVERMNRTMGKYLAKVVSDHQRDWDQYIHLFLLAYRSSVHETTGQTPANILFGRELRLPCDLQFGCKTSQEIAGEGFVNDLKQKMDVIHNQVRERIKIASDRMKHRYDIKAEEGGHRLGDRVWLFNPQRRRGLCPKLQRQWEGPYEVVKRINDVVYRIKKLPNGKPRVVHSNRLAPYAGSNENDGENTARVCELNLRELTFDEFMSHHGGNDIARYGVTMEVQQDLFTVPHEYSLAHCVAQDLDMTRGIGVVFKSKYRRIEELENQQPEIGKVLQLRDVSRYVYYLITKSKPHHKASYQDIWETLIELRQQVLQDNVQKLAMPKLGCSFDKLDWRIVRSMLEVLFRYTGVKILVCSYHHGKSAYPKKTIDCQFFLTSNCNRGSSCKYLHDFTKRDPGRIASKEGAM